MLGIIFVIFIARHIGNMAEERGKVKWHFWAATVAAWYGGQIIFAALVGILVGLFMGEAALDELNSGAATIVLGLIGGGIGYFIIYSIVKRMPYPESPDDLIDMIGGEEIDEEF